MLIIDVPYPAQADGTWGVDQPSGAIYGFANRMDAVRHAAKTAATLSSGHGGPVLLNIEGEDGDWRLFGPDLKAPMSAAS